MRERIHGRLTYANVMSTIAVFLVVSGGAAYARSHLPKNSVGSKQIRKNAVRTGDIARNAIRVGKIDREAVKAGKLAKNAVPTNRIRNNAVTGAKVEESTLGTVPTANAANIANSLAPSEGWHVVGAPGEPPFLNGWKNEGSLGETAAFYKDHEGIVHLRGLVGGAGLPLVFQLPPGYRPASGFSKHFAVACPTGCLTAATSTEIFGLVAIPEFDGAVVLNQGGIVAGFDGIAFRAES